MKTLLTTIASLFCFAYAHTQNVGIGTSTPLSPLHIAYGGFGTTSLTLENTRNIAEVSTSNIMIMFRHSGMNTGYISMTRNQAGNSAFQVNLGGDTKLHVQNNGNVGVGTETPTHKLEVAGTMLVGGYMGVGVSTPTARFDLSGTLRYRGSGFPNLPQPGAVLTSIDDDGSAQWQRPVVFKTRGLTTSQTIPKHAWTKIIFKNNDMEINQGLYFDPYSSVFNVPVKGAYHFDATVGLNVSSDKSHLRIVVYRNGGFLKEIQVGQYVCNPCGEDDDDYFRQLRAMKRRYYSTSGVFYLEQNDKVWIEVLQNDGEGYMYVESSTSETWFSGSLLYRL
jgi:hypothetical protein